ncbi:MAG: transglycosylase SLT domain-containing protein [Candidatus Aegiribacteria sp.]|nr:transglycosylase SLT domain-containing protein [Candidatus Aegiribacteria sp.]MBD3294124.1 transglycosylase SLT domain-containing protein [Candidatus Fermentibacteria bacterium]
MDIRGDIRKMRIVLLLWVLVALVSCRRVQEEEVTVTPPPEPEPTADYYSTTDSLYLAGNLRDAKNRLLAVLAEEPDQLDPVLFRLLGIYHGSARESRFVEILDSLEVQGYGPLTGWKVSALDLAEDPEIALLYAGGNDILLNRWLRWRADSTAGPAAVDPGMNLGQIYAAVVSAGEDTLDRTAIQLAASAVRFFPSVGRVLLRSIRLEADMDPGWSIRFLRSADTLPGTRLLLMQLEAEADSGSVLYWIEASHGTGGEALTAALELTERFQGQYTPYRRTADLLAEEGYTDEALEYSSSGDQWHRTKTALVAAYYDEDYCMLSLISDTLGPDAPDSLRARADYLVAESTRARGGSGRDRYLALLDFALEHPYHPRSRQAAYDAGKYHDCEQEWRAAAQAYLVSLRSSGTYGGDERAHWRGGFCLYMSGMFSKADSLWREGCEDWSEGYWRDEMLYWRARLADETGLTDQADSLRRVLALEHPWEFYGMLVADGSVGTPGISFAVPRIDLQANPLCSLAVSMTAEGYGVAAVEMLSRSAVGDTADRAAALSLLGRHGEALWLLRNLDMRLRENSSEKLPDTLLCFYFPAPYSELAESATDTLELEPSMLQGIMREESYFNRWVISSAGARGVVQLMPTTAYDVARWFGLPFLEEEDFFDPVISVPYGALYIDKQKRDFGRETPLFLAAYNAGPGNASRWVDMHGWNPADPPLYIEQITYRETRMYVKKVLRSAWIYERR